MQIVFVLFDRLTALDAIGPYEVLQRLPGADVVFAAKEAGVYRTDTKKLGLVADVALRDVPHPDVLVMPGGHGTRVLEQDEELLQWVRDVHAETTWTRAGARHFSASLSRGRSSPRPACRRVSTWASPSRRGSRAKTSRS